MTFANGQFCPHPLANPFNTRLGPSNYSLNPYSKQFGQQSFNSKSKELPDPIPFGMNGLGQDLHVPDTTPPMSLQSFQNIIDDYARDKTWDDRQIYLDMMNRLSKNSQGLSRKDIEYWRKVEIESAKLSANMSDEQKEMLEQAKKLGIFDTKLQDAPELD